MASIKAERKIRGTGKNTGNALEWKGRKIERAAKRQ